MSKYEKWSWAESKRRNPEMATFLKTVHDQAISEDEYAKQYMEMPSHELRTSEKKPRRQYNYLKTRFGFFGGTE